MGKIIRNSKKRQAILELLRNTKTHPTAEWVYSQLHEQFPNMSLATVYRNIAQLKEAGMITSLGIIDGAERLDGVTLPHSHAVCAVCGQVFDLDIPQPDYPADRLSGFDILGADLRISVICPECKNIKENKNG